MKSLTDSFRLVNGVPVPCIGFGTWQLEEGKKAVKTIQTALEAGYRHIDTAAAYENEASVGQAIIESGIPRKEIFVTSKLWNSDRGYDKALAAFDKTLQKLKLDYLDMYLVHWPASQGKCKEWESINADTWRAFEELYRDKRVRAIGVSNFMPIHLESLIKHSDVAPMVNQIEYHPGQIQQETIDYCEANDILVEAWSPLGSGRVLNNPDLTAIAKTYGKSVSQLCVRWCLQNGVLPLPKSETKAHIVQNADVFDFEISEKDMEAICRMGDFGGSGLSPDTVDF